MSARRVIWKFTLDPWNARNRHAKGARILHVREQSAQVRIWAEVDPDAVVVGRRFGIGLTGSGVPPGVYLGTAIVNEHKVDGLEVVVHVYDLGEEV